MSGFWIILTGSLVGAACALLGTFLVLRKMSLLGDAISHAVLPGIVIAFLLSGSRAAIPMFLGAAAVGILTTILIELFRDKWKVQEDASIGIVFTSLFALGVVLISIYAGDVDLDQQCVLYGEIAYTPWDTLIMGGQSLGPRPVWILGFVLIVNILFVTLFYKELQISSFDPAMAFSVGINASVIHYLLMGAVSMTTVAAFESVGAILVVAMLIVPGASAYLWSDRLPRILGLAVGFGVLSAIGGYSLSSWWNSSIAGAMTTVLGAIFLISFLTAPDRGMISKLLHQLRLSFRMTRDHLLLGLIRAGGESTRPALLESSGSGHLSDSLVLWRLEREGAVRTEDAAVKLTEWGSLEAKKLLRGHRLWEAYLHELGLPEDHVHRPADDTEHFLDEKLRERISSELGEAREDPHGKDIPPEEWND